MCFLALDWACPILDFFKVRAHKYCTALLAPLPLTALTYGGTKSQAIMVNKIY